MEKIFNLAVEFLKKIMPSFLIAVLIAVAGYFLTKLIVKICKTAMDKRNVDYSLEKFLLNCVRLGCYILIVIMALTEMGISTTGLLAGFSAAAAAVALALKDSLSNIASGIVLLFSKPFVTGDYIEFGDKSGNVVQIDLMHTRIMTFDHKCVMVPNSVISSTEVVNYTSQPQRRVDITVPVGYDADIEFVKCVLLNTLKENEKVLSEPEEPFVRVNTFSESSMDFILKAWVQVDDYWQVYYDLMESIKKNLDQNNIPIPYNRLDVHIDRLKETAED